MSSGVEFMTVFGKRCAVLPATEENVIRAAAVLFNRASTYPQIGDEGVIYAIKRVHLEATQSIDERTIPTWRFICKYGCELQGRLDIFIHKAPEGLAWEDAAKLVVVIPEK